VNVTCVFPANEKPGYNKTEITPSFSVVRLKSSKLCNTKLWRGAVEKQQTNNTML
jgi:hypothetical protein